MPPLISTITPSCSEEKIIGAFSEEHKSSSQSSILATSISHDDAAPASEEVSEQQDASDEKEDEWSHQEIRALTRRLHRLKRRLLLERIYSQQTQPPNQAKAKIISSAYM